MPTLDNEIDGDTLSDEPERVRFLLAQINNARTDKDKEAWNNQVRDAWREYQGQDWTTGGFRPASTFLAKNFNLYSSDTNIMLPALWTDTKPVSSRKFAKDKTALTASKIQEACANYIKDTSCFDETMRSSVLEYLHASMATARVYYNGTFMMRPKRVVVEEIPSVDPQTQEDITTFVDDNGEAPPEGAVIIDDPNGTKYYELENSEEEIETCAIYNSSLHFDEFLINKGARRQADVWLMMFKLRCTRAEAEDLFAAEDENGVKLPGTGFAKLAKIYKKLDAEDKERSKNETPTDKNIFEYWELWNLKTKKVYWLSEDCSDDFLKEKDDPYGLAGFFPCPIPMLVNEHYNDLLPTPDYTLSRDLYENLHLYMWRINIMLKSIKAPVLTDGSNDDFQKALSLPDGEYLAVKNFKDLLDKGGLPSLMVIPDFQPIANVLNLLIQQVHTTMEWIDKIRGTSDILRGTSEPEPTATAARFKRAAASNRGSFRMKEVIRFGRDLLEMDLDLMFKTFPDDEIKRICGFSYMDEEDKQRWDAALLLCKDDKSRIVRIQLETEDSSAIDSQDAKDDARVLLESFSSFIVPTLQAVQQMPSLAPLAFKVLEMAVSKFTNGKHAEDELEQVFDALREQMNQPPPETPPAPPDYEAQKIQLQQQKAQLDYQISQQEIQMKGMQQQFQQFMDQQQLQLDQRKQLFTEQATTTQLNMDYNLTESQLQEKLRDDQRLEAEAANNIQNGGMQQPKPPAVVINMPQPQPQVIQPPMMQPSFGVPSFDPGII